MTQPGGPTELPPLNALRNFEAVGRLGGIRAAAAELVVTPGAVSRQIRTLESWLGVPLFDHEGRALRLTDAGERYLRAASEHLGALGRATGELTGRLRSEHALQVRAYTLFATNWLIPRLTHFRRSQPWVEFELVTSSRPDEFGQGDVDAEIRGGYVEPVSWPDCDADLITNEELVLVCSPGFAGEFRLTEPADLLRLPSDTYLRSAAAPRLWPYWFETVGLPAVDMVGAPGYTDSSVTYRAAVAGQGVALAPLSFVENEVATDGLVVPFPELFRPLMGFYLVRPSRQPRRRPVAVFRSWLLAQARSGPPAAATVSSSRRGRS